MTTFYRGVCWGMFAALPLAAWVLLFAYTIGRAS